MTKKKTCSEYGVCGGCKLYEKTYEDQLELKSEKVKNKLKKFDIEILPIIPSPITYHYRNKIELTFFNTTNSKIGLGFHQQGQFNKLVNISKCLHSPENNALLIDFVRKWVNSNEISAYNKRSQEGILRYLIIRDSFKHKSKLLTFVTNGGARDLLDELAKELSEKFQIDGVIWSNQPEHSDAALLNNWEVLCGNNYIMDSIGEYDFKIPVNSFFQGNSAAATILYDYIKNLVKEGDNVLDLFCGAGTISTYIADKAKSVLGIEIVETATESAYENAKINNASNVEFVAGKVRERLANMSFDTQFDTVILDPPRAGTDKKTMRRIGALNPRQIIYVACGYDNLAYNLRILMEDYPYQIKSVQPLDLFPNTPHVETVIQLLRE